MRGHQASRVEHRQSATSSMHIQLQQPTHTPARDGFCKAVSLSRATATSSHQPLYFALLDEKKFHAVQPHAEAHSGEKRQISTARSNTCPPPAQRGATHEGCQLLKAPTSSLRTLARRDQPPATWSCDLDHAPIAIRVLYRGVSRSTRA